MAIEIRDASAQDADALAELSMVVHAQHVGWRPEVFRAPTIEEMKRSILELLGQENFREFVAVEEGKIVGLIAVRTMERAGHMLMFPRRFLDIESMCIQPQERGKGVGRALMERAKEFARQQGLQRIELNVWAENVEALNVFSAWGFRAQSRRMTLGL